MLPLPRFALLFRWSVSGTGMSADQAMARRAGIAPPSYCLRGCPGRNTISEPPFRTHTVPYRAYPYDYTAPITVACMSAIGTALPYACGVYGYC